MTARAVWFPGPRRAEVRDEAVPEVGSDQVRVRALCSAISHGTEMLVYRGLVDPGLALDLPTLQGSFGFPIKYGYASVGRIDQVGPDVGSVKKGDLVFVHHPHQSSYVVPEDAVVRLPKEVDPEAAAFLANLETAVNIVLDSRACAGDRVVVFGLGVVGLLVTQVLRDAGVATVVGVDPIERRRQVGSLVGATAAIEPGGGLASTLMELTGGAGADVAIEISGNPAALDQAIDCLRFQGTVVAASWYGTKPVTLHLGGAFHRNRIRIVSSQVSHIDPSLGPAWTRERRLAKAIGLLQKVVWEPLISHRFPIEEAPAAYRMLDEHPEDAVQVLFSYV